MTDGLEEVLISVGALSAAAMIVLFVVLRLLHVHPISELGRLVGL